MIKSSVEERLNKQKEILKMANETQAAYMGISRQALEEMNRNDQNR